MKLHKNYKIETQFSMSSMTDIIFLLLIFFMLTMSSVTNQGLTVDLPQSNNAATITPQVNVTITSNCDYYVDQELVKKETLKTLLQQKLDQDQPTILLHIDKSVSVAHMVYVTDIAAALNARLSVATQSD